MPDPKHAADRPATFGEVFADREFRAVFSASALSWCGDYLAKAAVTALVFTISDSVALSAAAFAVSFLPGLTVGPVLAALAERYPNRTVMISCDVIRAGLIGLVALPHMPVALMLLLVFATALLNPAFDASRSALTPRILTGDRYVVGLSAQRTAISLAQVIGYVAGGALAPYEPRLALLIDSLTFLISAACIAFGVVDRPVIGQHPDHSHLLRETAAGFRLVWTNPVLRAIAWVVLGSALFAVVPEGLGAAWAAALARTNAGRGFDQALIMMAAPTGAAFGALIIGRMVAPVQRQTLIRPLAVAVPGALVPAFVLHSAIPLAVLVAISGFAVGGLITSTNYLFVSALPADFRARAFGVMQFGLQLVQAVALLATGLLSDHIHLGTVVGIWSLVGAVGMIAVGMTWPSPALIDHTVSRVQEANAAAEAAASGDPDGPAGASTPRSRTGEPPTDLTGPTVELDAPGADRVDREARGGASSSGLRARRAARAERSAPRQDLPDHDMTRPGAAHRPVA